MKKKARPNPGKEVRVVMFYRGATKEIRINIDMLKNTDRPSSWVGVVVFDGIHSLVDFVENQGGGGW